MAAVAEEAGRMKSGCAWYSAVLSLLAQATEAVPTPDGRLTTLRLRASVRHTDAFSGEGQRDATLAGFPAQPVSSAI
jgi:hypothetical protein